MNPDALNALGRSLRDFAEAMGGAFRVLSSAAVAVAPVIMEFAAAAQRLHEDRVRCEAVRRNVSLKQAAAILARATVPE
ncbi:MAG: hypothetical protein U0791_24320 [Gemmataceae bacterium]